MPASQTTIVAFGPYSVRILTSMLAKPKIAFVGCPSEVAIDSGQREERPVDQAVAVDQEELVVGHLQIS